MIGLIIGIAGGSAIIAVLNRLTLPQGLHAPFVATGAVVTFALALWSHGSGFLAVYLAGLMVGNRAERAHTTIVAFLDAATWLGQIVMFVLLGLLAWPQRLPDQLLPALGVAATLMLVARPVAVFLCSGAVPVFACAKSCSSPGSACAARSVSSSPRSRCWSGCRTRQLYFDVGFVVVLVSLLVQGWTIAPAARWLRIAKKRPDAFQPRIELDLPGQRTQELVGYRGHARQSLSARRHSAVLGQARAGGARREGADAGGGARPA